jgi:hypothetical protein
MYRALQCLYELSKREDADKLAEVIFECREFRVFSEFLEFGDNPWQPGAPANKRLPGVPANKFTHAQS